MQTYPVLRSYSLQTLGDVVRYIIMQRGQDVRDWNNLEQVFMSGRKVGKVPSSSTDITSEDRIGDFNLTVSYAYYCVDDGSGNSVWRRIAMGSW